MFSKSAIHTNFEDKETENSHQVIAGVQLESNVMTRNMLSSVSIYTSTEKIKSIGRL